MEPANSAYPSQPPRTTAETRPSTQPKPHIRPARRADTSEIYHLLQNCPYTHVHVDWFTPSDWLGKNTFVVAEERGEITAVLAAAADTLPAAWMRAVALPKRPDTIHLLDQMLAYITPLLAAQGVTELGWISYHRWPDRWMNTLGFEQSNEIITYMKRDWSLPPLPPSELIIRPVLHHDMAHLAMIERDAYDPLWRHSAPALHKALSHALTFEVALQDGRLIGFQHSTPAQENGAHLARITIDPHIQGKGYGSTLLAHTLHGYQKRGLAYASLNTQSDNYISRRMYEKFGFTETSFRLPLWCKHLQIDKSTKE